MKTCDQQLDELTATLSRFRAQLPDVERVGNVLAQCLKDGGKLLTCGNGGSAADALHLAQELVGRYKDDRPSLAAICLSADATALTCIGNDYGYERVFARQVEGLAKPGDVLVAFTTSGNSGNVIKAFEVANSVGVTCVLVSGRGGGKALALADHAVVVPSETTARIQEVHTFILHLWLDLIEAALFA